MLEWQDKHGGIIIEQLKRLGCSCDWSRQRYTFDDDYVRAVQEVFVDLYRKGLIYRGRRMINWDPAAQTALSDEEVIPQTAEGESLLCSLRNRRRTGTFSRSRHDAAGNDHGRHRRGGSSQRQTLCRSNRQTRLASAGARKNSDHRRRRDRSGVWHRRSKSHAGARQSRFRDRPAPQPAGYRCSALRTGRINCPAVPELHGLDRFEARKKAAELLQESGLLSKIEPYENNVGFSDRSDVPIEPRLSEQWFLRYPKTKEALAVVRDHLIRFFPAHWEKVYAQWLENIQDWCISRQVWWGHRIPAWYRESGNRKSEQRSEDIYVGLEPPADPENWAQDAGHARHLVFVVALGLRDDGRRRRGRNFIRPVVLVTGTGHYFLLGRAHDHCRAWNSSPGKSERIEDNIPFRDVFFTGLIRDKQGRKMSKSLGNSPDPLELIDKVWCRWIALRSDADRAQRTGHSLRRKADRRRPQFRDQALERSAFSPDAGSERGRARRSITDALSIYAVEVLARLNETIDAVEAAYREYRFNAVAQTALRFFLERLLRLVRRSGQDGNLRRRRGAKEIGARRDGFRACPRSCGCSIRSCRTSRRSFGRCSVSATGFDSVRATASEDFTGQMSILRQKTKARRRDLRDGAGGPQFARGSTNSVEQKGAISFCAADDSQIRKRIGDDSRVCSTPRSKAGSKIQSRQPVHRWQ